MTDIEPIRWGVLGATSSIATSAVLPAMRASRTSEIVALGSRSGRSYDDVLADPTVEAVYVALPNGLHAEWVMRAAAAGKHVLCEKPLGMTGDEATRMVDACSTAGVVLMEAFMTPFHGRWLQLYEAVDRGDLGVVRHFNSAYTFRYDALGEFRFDPVLGGGVLHDVGIYVLGPILRLAGRPVRDVRATAVHTDQGVEVAVSGWLDFGDGLGAGFECSFDAPYTSAFEVTGSKFGARVRHPFVGNPDEFTGPLADAGMELINDDGSISTTLDAGRDPYRAMVEHFVACIRTGAPVLHTPVESIALAELIDLIRTRGRESAVLA